MLLKLSPRLKSLFIVMVAVLLPMGAGLAGNGGERPVNGSGGLFAEPATLDFGSVEVGMDKVLSVTVSNAAKPGAEAVTLDALGLDGVGILGPSTSLVSLTPEGGQWGGGSARAVITPDGRYVVFPGQPGSNSTEQIYRHDLLTGTVEMASVNAEGGSVTLPPYDGGFALRPDGRYVAFKYSGSGDPPVPDGPPGFYMRDMDAGVTEYIDMPTIDGELPNGQFARMSFSADFRLMVFTSFATNLVPGIGFSATRAYVYNRDAGTVELVSVTSDGTPYGGMYPAISADGRYVAFLNPLAGLVPDDTNGEWDIFVHDREAGITERVSVASGGGEGNADVQVEALPAVSADGRYVAFSSQASNLVPDDTNGRADVFVRDRVAGTTERVSVTDDGSQSLGASLNPVITPDGRYVVFHSDAPNLVPNDGNGQLDTFMHDRVTGATERVSVATDGTEGNFHSFIGMPGISADGRFVTFATSASNLAPDGNGEVDIFVRDRGGPALGTAFAITGGDCAVSSMLEPGDSCTVEITFGPDSTGVFEDTLTLEADDEQSVSVMLHGTAPQGPVLAFNPLSLDLGDVSVGITSEPQNATLTNTGDSDATGLEFTASGGGNFFEADTTECGDTLPVGENCQLIITFTPPGIGLTFAALTAESDEGATARLNLVGEGGHGGLGTIFSDRFEQTSR